MHDNLDEILENEWYLVRHSGETPEIALHASLYYLTRDKSGPQLTLRKGQRDKLCEAAIMRFSEIVIRDLQHENYGSQAYRGIGRSIINYRRFLVFCERQNINPDTVCKQAACALKSFLRTEVSEVHSSKRLTIINCNRRELSDFATELGVDLMVVFPEIEGLCLPFD